MKYNIKTNERMSKLIYSMSTYDIEWEPDNGAFKQVLKYLKLQAMGRAQSVCLDETDKGGTDKTYDRGYVKGLFEAVEFLRKSCDQGRELSFPRKHENTPKIV